MTTQIEKANLLRKLHTKGDPLILFNVWDAGTAKLVEELGAKIIATSSVSVANSHGYEDGENIPFDLMLANLERMLANVDLPVTCDIEAGYGQTLSQIQENVTRVINAGAVGVNFEDQIIGTDKLLSIDDQCERIQAIATAAKSTSVPLYINARTDIFFKVAPENHGMQHIEETIERATAYARAGADCIFTPGLKDEKLIEALCKSAPVPVNIKILADGPGPQKVKELGASRISYGPLSYSHVMAFMGDAVRKALSLKDL